MSSSCAGLFLRKASQALGIAAARSAIFKGGTIADSTAKVTTALGPLSQKKLEVYDEKITFRNFCRWSPQKKSRFSVFFEKCSHILGFGWFWSSNRLENCSQNQGYERIFRKILKILGNFEVANDKNFRKLFFHHKLQVFFVEVVRVR